MHVESGRHLYGGARQVAYLIEGLAALGVENVLVAAAGSEPAALPLAAERVALPMGGDLDAALLARLENVIADHSPDVVHVHSRRGADLYGGRAARRRRVPAVVTRRVDSAEPAAWMRFKYRPYAAVVAISSAIERDLAERARIEAARLARIPSAVDTARFAPDPSARTRLACALGIDASVPVVGVVAQLIARKGHDTLLDAWPRVLDAFPEARLAMLGRGPCEARLRRAAAAAGLEERVRFLGHRDDAAALVPGLDVLAHPARREGLGLAVLEGMSAGVAVVAAAAGGLVDAITSGVDGELVEPGRPEALARAIHSLLAEPARRRRLGTAARARMMERHSIAGMSRAYARLYERLAAPADAGAGLLDTHDPRGETRCP